jgi:hypothetical protein
MKIDRNNYEVFIIDFFDGKLNAEATSALMLFLDENLDLKEEFELFKQPLPKPEQIVFEKKEKLKKQAVKAVAEINENNYENYFIAFYEGDLHQEEKTDLEIFLGLNEFLREEFQLFEKLSLQADTSIIFPDKKVLKKKPELRIVYYAVSVAAIALLFFSIYPLFKTESPSTPIFERTQLSSMQKTDPVKNISETVEANIYISENKIKPIELVEGYTAQIENTVEPENNELASIEIKEIPIEEIISTDYTLAENLAEYIAFADISEDAIPEKEKKSALGRVINKNVGGLLAIFKRGKKDTSSKDEPGFVKFLDQSLLVFNTITGSDKELTKMYNKDGKLSSYGFEGGAVNLNRNLGKQ